jgi:hypothetical protein
MPFSKEEILTQIRRLATANGGIAPGRLTLESESGIRESDWSGVYWARYSDAVREAGFEPNKLNTAYKADHVLEILARVTRELGHIPTYPELALQARSQKGFPAGKTFGRLGSKTEQTEKLLAFCRKQSGFSDVLTICEAALAAIPKNEENSGNIPSGESNGVVYLFKSGRRYKFGFTNDADRRIRELAHQTAEPINKVHSIQTDDPSGIEAYWKRRFAAKCVHNEWFILDAKDVAAFRRRKKFM